MGHAPTHASHEATATSASPSTHAELAERRQELGPGDPCRFPGVRQAGFADGALDRKTKQVLIEAIWVAAEMRAGGAYAHSILALETASHTRGPRAP